MWYDLSIFIQTKLESFNLLLPVADTCSRSAADSYMGYIQIQNIWTLAGTQLATSYKLWLSLHKWRKMSVYTDIISPTLLYPSAL